MSALRETIEDFMVRYAHALDDQRIDDWPGFFTDDARYQITTRENEEAGFPLGIVLCEGRGMLEDRVQALKIANVYESHVYCHLLGRPELGPLEDSTIRARTNFSVVRTMEDGRSELFATGKFVDVIVLDAGEPRFKERRVVLDSRRIDTLLVIPL